VYLFIKLKPAKWFFTALVTIVVLASRPVLAQTTTISWDSLPSGAGVFVTPDSPAYDGYDFFFGDSTFGSIGPNDGNHGPLQYTLPGSPLLGGSAPYNAWGNTPIRVESLDPTPDEAFTFSGWFSGQPNLGSGAAQVEAEGFTGTSSTPSFTTTFSLPSDGSWVDEDLTAFGAFNKFLLSPLDASGNPSAFLAGYIYMDDVQFTVVPEPSSWALAIVAGAALFCINRRWRATGAARLV